MLRGRRREGDRQVIPDHGHAVLIEHVLLRHPARDAELRGGAVLVDLQAAEVLQVAQLVLGADRDVAGAVVVVVVGAVAALPVNADEVTNRRGRGDLHVEGPEEAEIACAGTKVVLGPLAPGVSREAGQGEGVGAARGQPGDVGAGLCLN